MELAKMCENEEERCEIEEDKLTWKRIKVWWQTDKLSDDLKTDSVLLERR